MGRTTKPLSATQVEAAKPKVREYNLSDGNGLHLRVRPNGSKSWLFNYSHPRSGKRTNLGLGMYPSLTLAVARRMRAENLELLSSGIDPKKHREEITARSKLQAQQTFEAVAREWLQLHSSRVSSKTRDDIEKSLKKNAFPFIGKIAVKDISFSILKHDVINRIIKRESLEIARKMARRINQVLSYAVINEYVEHNVATDLTKLIPASQQVNLPALRPEEW